MSLFLTVVVGSFCGMGLWVVASYLLRREVVRVAIWLMSDQRVRQQERAVTTDMPFPVERDSIK